MNASSLSAGIAAAERHRQSFMANEEGSQHHHTVRFQTSRSGHVRPSSVYGGEEEQTDPEAEEGGSDAEAQLPEGGEVQNATSDSTAPENDRKQTKYPLHSALSGTVLSGTGRFRGRPSASSRVSSVIRPAQGSTAALKTKTYLADDDDENPVQPHRFLISADVSWKHSWDWFIILLVLYNSTVIPWSFAFQRDENTAWKALDYTIDALFFADLTFSFHSGFYDKHGVEVTDIHIIRRRYLAGWFPVDFAATFPFELIAIFFYPDSSLQLSLFNLFKIPRLLRLGRLMKKMDSLAGADAFRIVKLLASFALVSHWIACAWFFLGRYQVEGNLWTGGVWLAVSNLCQTKKGEGNLEDGYTSSDEVGDDYLHNGVIACIEKNRHPNWWVDDLTTVLVESTSGGYNSTEEVTILPDADGWTQYIASVYWTMTTLTTVGYGDISPTTNTERVFTCVVMLIGAVVYASIFGSVAVLIQNFDASDARYKEKMDALKEFAAFYDLEHNMYMKMVNYSDALHFQNHGFDAHMVLKDLPSTFKMEVYGAIHRDLMVAILKASPYLTDSQNFLQAMLSIMRPQVCIAQDYVIRRGEVGKEMYFISKGIVEVIAEATSKPNAVHLHLGPGEHFGEMSLFTRNRRGSSVRAATFCELYYLNFNDFDELECDYPTDAELLRLYAKARLDVKQRHQEEQTKEKIHSRRSQILDHSATKTHSTDTLPVKVDYPTEKEMSDLVNQELQVASRSVKRAMPEVMKKAGDATPARKSSRAYGSGISPVGTGARSSLTRGPKRLSDSMPFIEQDIEQEQHRMKSIIETAMEDDAEEIPMGEATQDFMVDVEQ
ncbi:hypothetical protein CYMTET_55513, partial [Cymbomonas tetramitiformis]